MKHRITSVDPGSPASRLRIKAGSFLLSLNGREVADVIDYELFCAKTRLELLWETPEGETRRGAVKKPEYQPLGLNFESGLMSPLRSCRNHCIFCFIDQMPKGIRPTLEVKDDDWRLSLIMGNYVTLTNVDEEEFTRILSRRASPLYISVHATDPDVRARMMKNPTAAELMPRLERLSRAGLRFHGQVVLCPGVNDGAVLNKTIRDLSALHPAARSLAIVPVGLTRHRRGLPALRCLTAEEARETVETVERFQREYLSALGTRFVFPADELYLKAGLPLPEEDCYEDYHQLENGVGLLRRFEGGFLRALEEREPLPKKVVADSACGVIAAPFLSRLFERLERYGITVRVHPVKNRFFGESVTVSGLVTAGDILEQLRPESKTLLLPHTMLREGEDVFLDGTRLHALKEALGMRVLPMNAGDGGVFIGELFSALGEG